MKNIHAHIFLINPTFWQNLSLPQVKLLSKPDDEGMTNRPSTFAYLGFGPEEITTEGITRPIKAAARCGPGSILDVQARGRRVQVELVLG
jgi:hypothetical protein